MWAVGQASNPRLFPGRGPGSISEQAIWQAALVDRVALEQFFSEHIRFPLLMSLLTVSSISHICTRHHTSVKLRDSLNNTLSKQMCSSFCMCHVEEPFL